MITVTVHASKEYDVLIGPKLLEQSGERALQLFKAGKTAVITDDKVDTLYAKTLCDSLEKSGFYVCKKVFPNGEKIKTPENAIEIVDFLAENRFTRSDVVFALGGGTVGDLSGFAASIYLRGIKLVQVPTTLLAAVDSSVGGKTAVNLKAGKNLAGSFYQPDLVLCDTNTLQSLPEGVFRDGCSEVIKYGVIKSRSLFDELKKDIKCNLEEIIGECVRIKSDIVAVDEQDRGVRQLLNFGHTIGHAIERFSNFSVPHGEAVAIGMVASARAAYKKGYCSRDVYEEIYELIKRYRLPVSTDIKAEQLLDPALSDKKREEAYISLVVPEYIGEAVTKKVSVDGLSEFIRLGLNE